MISGKRPLVSVRTRLQAIVLVFCATLAACSNLSHAPLATEPDGPQVGRNFPYHPLVYHLDLSVLAYHLHAQSLVWPFDPYYEALPGGDSRRKAFMGGVRQWIDGQSDALSALLPTRGGLRGPGILAGFDDNPRHDPILYRYGTLYPWDSAITNAGERWLEYSAPKEIIGNVRNVFACYRRPGTGDNTVVEKVASNPRAGARDTILAFEGGTGDKGEVGQPASQSLMGFVLVRHRTGGEYDIHISFRGSRSGSLIRSVAQANWDSTAAGNPDWITDLGFSLIGPEKGASHVTTVGSVHRGFAKTTQLMLPNIFACLKRASALAGGRNPTNIFVTGHSLGGGLAQHFASAVLMGNEFGPAGNGPLMPQTLARWPWNQLKLISFSAPRAGDPVWAKALTVDGLQADFHSNDLLRYDQNALAPNDTDLVARLNDADRPAGYRVLVSNDAISTSLVSGRKPVGKTVYVDKLRPLAIINPYTPASHDPAVVRNLMVRSLNDTRIPAETWRYRSFETPLSNGGGTQTSPVDEYTGLQTVIRDYHRQNSRGFDARKFSEGAAVFNQLLNGFQF